MPSIRKAKTASGATAIQVVRYENRKVVIMKHIGSAHTPLEIAALIESAEVWIARETPQQPLFEIREQRTLVLAAMRYVGVTHIFARTMLLQIAGKMGFLTLNTPLLIDLAIMRIIEPTSKLRAITLMERYFNVQYAERSLYRKLPLLKALKKDAEQIAVTWAKNGLGSDLALVLYDVTTLYFESFTADELRVPGFSKDSKSQQPQIVVGLIVTREGFPLGYEVFKGNTFEGHTMLPMLDAFVSLHGVATPIVVADAAMISRENVAKLNERKLSYIVGARLANASPTIIKKVSDALGQKDGATIRVSTEHGDLIAEFSAKRYRKDKADMEKQIAKAEALVKKREPGKRAKFVMKKDDADEYVLHEALVAKTTQLLGIKGYYTNIIETILSDRDIVDRYHDLWHVEAAFRMTKSDLDARPIFHHKEDAVRAHMLICFVALAMGKHLEMKSGRSLRRIVDTLFGVTDALIVDTTTGEQFTLRSELDEDVRTLLRNLGLSY